MLHSKNLVFLTDFFLTFWRTHNDKKIILMAVEKEFRPMAKIKSSILSFYFFFSQLSLPNKYPYKFIFKNCIYRLFIAYLFTCFLRMSWGGDSRTFKTSISHKCKMQLFSLRKIHTLFSVTSSSRSPILELLRSAMNILLGSYNYVFSLLFFTTTMNLISFAFVRRQFSTNATCTLITL